MVSLAVVVGQGVETDSVDTSLNWLAVGRVDVDIRRTAAPVPVVLLATQLAYPSLFRRVRNFTKPYSARPYTTAPPITRNISFTSLLVS